MTGPLNVVLNSLQRDYNLGSAEEGVASRLLVIPLLTQPPTTNFKRTIGIDLQGILTVSDNPQREFAHGTRLGHRWRPDTSDRRSDLASINERR